MIEAQLSIAMKRFHQRFAFVLESLLLLQFEQFIVKESTKTPTDFHKNYFSEETDPDFSTAFAPSPAVQDLGAYL